MRAVDKTASKLMSVPCAYKPTDVKTFPLKLTLEPVPGRDVGNAGIWNQYEFASAMMKVSVSWLVNEVEYHQIS